MRYIINNKKNKISKIFLIAICCAVLMINFIFVKSCTDNKAVTSENEITTEPQNFGSLSNNGNNGNNGIDDGETDISDTCDTTDTSSFDTSDISDTADTAGTTEKKQSPTGSGQTANKKYYSYLTGLECTRTEQRKRPVSIIINNIRQAMPNVGISHADIIYECLAEGGITRLMMVLTDYENVSVFGSVRSSREYFIDLSRSHDTIYVHAGGNPQDYDQFDKRAIDRIDGVNMNFPNTFYRDAQRRKTMALEHTLMTSGAGIIAGIKQAKYRTTLNSDYKGAFKFNEKIKDIGGTDNTANYVWVPYSNGFAPEFIYNPDDKLYYRKQFGAAHIDGETGEQIRFQNVVVMFAEYTPFTESEIARKEGHLACKLTGDGYGFYITNGKYKTIQWKKDTRDSVLNFFNLDGSELYLNPGKSFICVTSKAYNKNVVINSDVKDIKDAKK